MKTVSISELIQYYKCQRAYYLERILRIKGAPYLPFVIGNSVHHFIAYWLHRETPEGRTFFYKTEESAINGFKRFFLQEIWPEHDSEFDDKQTKWKALNIGIKNIKNYMEIAKGRGVPLYMEKELSFPIQELNCKLTGTIDQIRNTGPEWARKNGLKPGGVVLIDLKTGTPQYEILGKNNDQIDLVNNMQATMYWLLYEKIFGKAPDAFTFWFLGGERGTIVTTTRGKQDEEEMLNMISGFMKSIGAKVKPNSDPEEWPKTPDTHQCKFCRHFASCYPRLVLRLSAPMYPEDAHLPFGTSHKAGITEYEEDEQLTLPKILEGIPRKRKLSPDEEDRLLIEKYEKTMRGEEQANS